MKSLSDCCYFRAANRGEEINERLIDIAVRDNVERARPTVDQVQAALVRVRNVDRSIEDGLEALVCCAFDGRTQSACRRAMARRSAERRPSSSRLIRAIFKVAAT